MKATSESIGRDLLYATLLIAMLMWVADSVMDYLWFDKGGVGFFANLMPIGDPQVILKRILVTSVLVVSGGIVSGMYTRVSESEQAAREREERFNLALTGANDGIWDWHLGADTVHFDSRYYTMAGYEPFEFPGAFEEWEKRVHPNDIRDAKLAISEILSGDDETFETTFRFLRKDGAYMWIRAKGKIVARDEAGTPIRFIGTHSDITDRKHVEEALRESRQLLANVFESMQEGVLVLDTDFKYSYWNRKMQEISFTPREDVLGTIPWEKFPFLSKEIREAIRNAMHGKISRNIELKYKLSNGTEGWTRESYFPLRDDDAKIAGIVGVIEDITNYKQAEEDLKQARNYISNIINSMPSLLVGVDAKGKVTQWNLATERRTGLSSEEAAGKQLGEVIPYLSVEMGRVRRAIEDREVQTDLKRIRRDGGKTRYEDVTVYPLISNGVEGAVIRVDDVTEQVRLEEMMIQSEKMLSVGGLAAGMAHEINNPLAGMLQTAEVMSNRLTHMEMPANRRIAEEVGVHMAAIKAFMEKRGILRMITTIESSGRRVASIVENMLNFARKSESKTSSQDIVGLLDKTLELAATDYDLKKHYDFKTIRIKKEYADNPPVVPCEGAEIQQVLLNILRNGAQAMQAGKGAGDEPRFVLRLKLEKARGMICIEIEDNGPGMDEETRKRVFEPFFTTKPAGEGTGLGLSVSYFIVVENHGGEMAVESRPGFGTKFMIRLPLSARQSQRVRRASSALPMAGLSQAGLVATPGGSGGEPPPGGSDGEPPGGGDLKPSYH